nr:hypothetical protein [Tanacetum cinerariifolium]
MINAQIADLSSNNSKYTSPALTQKVFANIRRVSKGFSGMDTTLFDGMLVPQQVQDDVSAAIEDEDIVAEPTSPTPVTTPPPQQELIPSPSQDKIAQAIEFTKLKQRVRRLEIKRELKALGFKRLRKVGTTQRVESSADTVMDDQEDASKQGEIAKLDANEDITLETVDAEDADVQGRLPESQAQVYHLDLVHPQKVLSMQETNEAESAEVEEVIKVVTTAKLMTEVVTTTAATTTATTITAALIPKASAPRRRRGVIIHDPEEDATTSVSMQSEVKFKDKGKGILVEEPKPLKRQAQIEQDEAFARELEAELNTNINWNEVIEQVKRKEKQNNTIMRYQALKRKPVIEAHARKNIMKITKKQKIDEEVKELRTHLQIVPNDEDDVYTEAIPLATKVPVVDY